MQHELSCSGSLGWDPELPLGMLMYLPHLASNLASVPGCFTSCCQEEPHKVHAHYALACLDGCCSVPIAFKTEFRQQASLFMTQAPQAFLPSPPLPPALSSHCGWLFGFLPPTRLQHVTCPPLCQENLFWVLLPSAVRFGKLPLAPEVNFDAHP